MKKQTSEIENACAIQDPISRRSAKTAPIEISTKEWEELLQTREVQEDWGLDDDTDAMAFSKTVYGVKFHFVSGCPGYVGDLYILQGDCLERPIRLIRERGVLKQISESK